MPASLFSDLEFSSSHQQLNNNKAIEDTRALQVALELSMLYMSSDQRQQPKADNSMSNNSMDTSSSLVQSYIPNGYPDEPRNKKSQNMTECVPVPSSEHVAEIVGRQGNINNYAVFYQCSYLEYFVRFAFPFPAVVVPPVRYIRMYLYSRATIVILSAISAGPRLFR